MVEERPSILFAAEIRPGAPSLPEGVTSRVSLREYARQVGRRVRYLTEVKAFEATVTPFPMNQLARVSEARPGRPRRG